MDDTHKKKSGFLRILLIMMLLAVAIVAVALAVTGGGSGTLSGLWQSITGKTQTTEYYYENSAGGTFNDVGDGFAVMSSAGLYMYDNQGGEQFSRLFSYSYPAMWAAGKYGVACDIGGNSVIFFSADKIICELETEFPVVSASVNEDGYMCVCTEESGYLGSVTVYNPSGTDIYKWYSGSARVLSADVNGNSELLILSVGNGGSSLVLCELSSEQEKARYEYSGLIIDAGFCSGGVTAVTTASVLNLTGKLEDNTSYDFSGRYLESYDLENKFIVLTLGDYQVGGEKSIITVNNSGKELGLAIAESDILSLDAAKDGVAVLYDRKITVYNSDMVESFSVECAAGTESVSLRDDGTVLAAGAFSAYVYATTEEN